MKRLTYIETAYCLNLRLLWLLKFSKRLRQKRRGVGIIHKRPGDLVDRGVKGGVLSDLLTELVPKQSGDEYFVGLVIGIVRCSA